MRQASNTVDLQLPLIQHIQHLHYVQFTFCNVVINCLFTVVKMVLSEILNQILDLQLFDGLSPFADDQADFVSGDEDLLNWAVAIHVVVEAGAVTTLLHNLTQQSLGLPAGEEWGRCKNTFVTTYSKQKMFLIVKSEWGVQVIQ